MIASSLCRNIVIFSLWAAILTANCDAQMSPRSMATASSTAIGSSEAGAIDGNRFSTEPNALWKGAADQKTWWWQVSFTTPCQIGAILQINSDDPQVLHNAAEHYCWQASLDGHDWQDLKETETKRERRLFRVHRLSTAVSAKYLRLAVSQSLGECPTLREVEFYAEPSAKIEFPDWIVAVNTRTETTDPTRETGLFVNLARQCEGWEKVLAQQIWMGDFDESFVVAEPYPMCAFLTGNGVEWCQQPRSAWRGVAEVVKNSNLPIWGACGGAQGMAIIETVGIDRPLDCPRCRDPENPKSPVYTHIGHTGDAKCGDYSKNIWERGLFNMRKVARDPAFEGLPEVFPVMESHCGQMAFVPEGWVRVVTNGPDALTENQCLRMRDRYIYAAQFHIELQGTPDSPRIIMGNFLSLAKQWGGYNPAGKPVPLPPPM